MNAFLKFKQNLLNYGLEYFGLYYSTYEAVVIDNDDPEKRGRIQVKCPRVWKDNDIEYWIIPRGTYAGKKTGFHAMPQKKDVVWVTFRGGKPEPEFAMWEHGWWLKDEAIEEAGLDVYVMSTPKGHTWVINEADDTMYFSFKDGKVIEIKGDNISLGTLGGSAEAAALGDTTKNKLDDICSQIEALCDAISALTVPTAMGPSGTPINAAQVTSVKTQVGTIKSELTDILSKVVTLD